MRLLLALLAAPLFAQSGPTVTTTTTVVAAVGQLTCTGTPLSDSKGVNTFHVSCTLAGTPLADATTTVPVTAGTSLTMSVSSGLNQVSWIVTKGNPAPDGWQVTVTDGAATVFKTGTF